MAQIEGYVDCARCGAPELRHVAWQTRGVCFPCFANGELARFREVEITQRRARHSIRRKGANKRAKTPNRGPNTQNAKADQARAKAQRRLSHLFPEVFDVLYAEERFNAGLAPRPHVEEGHLARAAETYAAFAAYYAQTDRSDDGLSQA